MDARLLDWTSPPALPRLCGCPGSLVVAVLPDDPMRHVDRALSEHPGERVLAVLRRRGRYEFAVVAPAAWDGATDTVDRTAAAFFDRLRTEGTVDAGSFVARWVEPSELALGPA